MRYFYNQVNNHFDWLRGTREFSCIFTPKIWDLKIKLGWKG